MALYKDNYTNQFGIPTQYWKVTGINLNTFYKYCDIELAGFYSQETRDANKEPLEKRKVRAKWTPEEFEAYFSASALDGSSIYLKAYEYIKNNEFFQDCIDI
jgi:hypothetical protein